MKSLFVVSIVAALFATGTAFQCYKCQSPPYAACELEPFEPGKAGVEKEVCLQNKTCSKGVAYSLDCSNKLLGVIRGCTPWDIGESESSIHTTEATIKTFFCKTDLCNGAHSTTAAATTSFAVALLFIIRNF